MQVLKTIPWAEVDIEVVTVEVNHAGEVAEGSEEEIRRYLAARGYVYFHTVGMDAVFIRRDCYEVSSRMHYCMKVPWSRANKEILY